GAMQELTYALLEALEGRHQCLRHVTPAEGPETPALVGQSAGEFRLQQLLRLAGIHRGIHLPGSFVASSTMPRKVAVSPPNFSIARTAPTKARMRSASLSPGAVSTPLETSTPCGATVSIAAATLSLSRPPARIMLPFFAIPAAISQSTFSPRPLAGPS